MAQRLLLIVVLAAFGGLAATQTGCAHPYSGKAEKLKKPKKKKKEKKEDEPKQAEVEIEDTCRTNFFDDPVPLEKRKADKGEQLAKKADQMLLEAEQYEGVKRYAKVIDALGTLKNALKADPYGPEPTYKMAVAYALVGKRKCAIALLERLPLIGERVQESSKEAMRVIQRAMRDAAFEEFRQDANTALGE